jgi:hypothetical protein
MIIKYNLHLPGGIFLGHLGALSLRHLEIDDTSGRCSKRKPVGWWFSQCEEKRGDGGLYNPPETVNFRLCRGIGRDRRAGGGGGRCKGFSSSKFT